MGNEKEEKSHKNYLERSTKLFFKQNTVNNSIGPIKSNHPLHSDSFAVKIVGNFHISIVSM